ncbi:rho-associated protein kinase 2-like [Cimex lectularius]|uniref:Coiled-coil domain-containing protein 63 n=1 Tax=Cimex lectularius TaxID=79782 RepID=A0A8I6RCU0_CIMLE|nr:rho-associated protein kinase 2-like [Cimex lectularius]
MMNTTNGDQKLQRPLKKNDTRWTDKDKVKQLKGIAELHERTLKWMKVKKGAQVEKYKKEGRELDKKTEKIRRMLKDISQGDSAQIREILKRDKEAWLICKDQTPDGVIECLDHLIFLQRRELDRLKFEVELNNKKLFDAKLQEEMMNEAEKEKIGPAKFRVQELAAEIEHVKTQTKAANLVEKTYDRLKRILKKESLNIDEILDGLKVDMLVQAECILKAMEMGQTAVEDKANFILEYKKEMKLAKEEKEKHMQEIKRFKQMITRVKQINSSLARAESFVKINYQSNEEKQKFIKDLQEKVKKRKEQFKILMYVTTSNAPHEVFPRIEAVMKERFRLLRQLEINKMVRDTEVTRKNYMDYTLETIQENDILQTREYQIKKKELEDRIDKYRREVEQYKKKMAVAGRYVLQLRKNIYHFNRLFADVKIGNPGPTNLVATMRGEEDEDDDIFDDCDPKEFDDDDPERVFAPDSDSSSDNHEIDMNAAHIIDIITIKLNIILNEMKEEMIKREQKNIQLPDEDFTFETSSASESEVEDLKGEEDYMQAGYYVGELGGDTDEEEELEREEEFIYRKKLPTRLDLKIISQRIVDVREAHPTLTAEKAQIKKHICY